MSQVNVKELPEEIKNRLRSDIQINTLTQCVTELVFNSLDAKSTAIAVRINLLRHRIQVVDNGEGITLNNMENIGARYMTSKCQSTGNFERKQKTYGYKGESLASIIMVSQKVEITSRTDDSKTYLKVFLNGKEDAVLQTKGRPSMGTTVTIQEFLYNCSVRQNRIKKIDINYVKKMLENLTLIFPGVSFSLRNDETADIILNSHKEKTVSHVLCSLNTTLDIKLFSEIKVVNNNIHISSLFYMTSTSITNMQYFYVNKFPVFFDNLQKLIKKSLYNRLDDIFLSHSAYPVYVINIQCPYSEVEIYFDSSRYVAEFKSWHVIERCIEKVIKLYIKKYNKHQERSTQKNNKTTELLDDENVFEELLEKKDDFATKPKNSKPKKTLGIRYNVAPVKSLQGDDNNSKKKSKMKKTLGIRHQGYKPVIQKTMQNESPKKTLNDTSSNFICLANAQNNIWAPNKLLGIFDENYDPQNLTLPKLLSQNFQLVEHNEQEGKKEIMELFMKSLPASQQFRKDEEDNLVSENRIDYSFTVSENKSSSKINSETIEPIKINPTRDISMCIKQQDNSARKRQLEKLNSVGTCLIEKKIKLQNSYDEEKHLNPVTKTSNSTSTLNKNVGNMKASQCDITVLLPSSQKDVPCDYKAQNICNTRETTATATSSVKSHRTIACQTDGYSSYDESENLERIKKQKRKKSLVKYNTIATSPFFSKAQVKKANLVQDYKRTTSFTAGISPLKNSEINLLSNYFEEKNNCNIKNKNHETGQDKVLCLEDITEANNNFYSKNYGKETCRSKEELISNEQNDDTSRYLQKLSNTEQNQRALTHQIITAFALPNNNFCFEEIRGNSIIHNNNDVTFNSHYFQLTPTKKFVKKEYTKIGTKKMDVYNARKDKTIVEVNTENIVHDLTFQNIFTPNRRLPQNSYSKIQKANAAIPKTKEKNKALFNDLNPDINASKYFTGVMTNFKEPKMKKTCNKKKSILVDTSTFNFQTPTKTVLKETRFPDPFENEALMSESAVTFGHFEPQSRSTQKEDGYSGKFNFFESFLFDDLIPNKHSNTLKAEHKYEEDVHRKNDATINEFQFEQPNLQEENLFSMNKRIAFVPKGLSPILKETKVLDVTLSPNSKKKLNNVIVKSFEDEMHLVKWMDYIDKDDPKEFFDKLYSAKQKMIEKNIPNIHTEYRIPHDDICRAVTFNKELFPATEIIGQLDNKFIIGISKSKLFLFDQHAVHERIRLECLYNEYIMKSDTKYSKFKSSLCSRYIKMTFPNDELHFLKVYKNLFEDIGFEYDVYKSYILIKKIPQCLHKRNIQDQTDEFFYNFIESLLREEISNLQETRGVRSNIPRLLQYAMSTEACRGAIKFGHQLENEECKKYIKMLAKCQLPFQCAHGRPTICPILSISPLAETTAKIDLRKLLVNDS